MKKILALVLALVMVFALAACGQQAAPAPAEKPAEAPAEKPAEAPAEAPADPMEELIAAAKAEGELTVYGSCEEDYLNAACNKFEELYGIKVNRQRLSTGEVPAKIEEENGHPSADVWFGGTNNPYDSAAAKGLLDNSYVPVNASHITKDIYKDPNGYWYGIYTGILGFMVNTDEMTRLGLEIPQSWDDLLKPEYKGLIWLQVYTKSGSGPSKNVGTGECVIGIGFLHDGITQILDNGYENVQLVVPSPGTACEVGPVAIFKGASHPNAARLFVEYALSPDCVEQADDNGSYQFLVIDNAEQPAAAAQFGLDPSLVWGGYDFAKAAAETDQNVEDVMNAIAAAGADTGADRFKTE